MNVRAAEMALKSNAVLTGDGLLPFKGGVVIADGKILACRANWLAS